MPSFQIHVAANLEAKKQTFYLFIFLPDSVLNMEVAVVVETVGKTIFKKINYLDNFTGKFSLKSHHKLTISKLVFRA